MQMYILQEKERVREKGSEKCQKDYERQKMREYLFLRTPVILLNNFNVLTGIK